MNQMEALLTEEMIETYQQALDEAFETTETLTRLQQVVQAEDTPLSETAQQVLVQAIEHYCQRVGIPSKGFGLESYADRSQALESLTDTIRTVIERIIQAIVKFAQNVRLFLKAFNDQFNRDELRLITLKRKLHAFNSTTILNKSYTTRSVHYWIKNFKDVTPPSRHDSVTALQLLNEYQHRAYEFDCGTRIREALMQFKPMLRTLNKRAVSEADIETVLQASMKVFFTESFSKNIKAINGKHIEKHDLFFNEDKLIASYHIPNIYQAAATPRADLRSGNHPMGLELTLTATNGKSLLDLVQALEKVLKVNNGLRENIAMGEDILNGLKESLQLNLSEKDKKPEDLSLQMVLVRDIFQATLGMVGFAKLFLNRHSRMIDSYARFIEAVI